MVLLARRRPVRPPLGVTLLSPFGNADSALTGTPGFVQEMFEMARDVARPCAGQVGVGLNSFGAGQSALPGVLA